MDPAWTSDYDAWLPSVSLQVRVSAGSLSGLAWSLYKCAALWRAVYGHSPTERQFVKRREFPPGFRFLSHCDMTLAVESDAKPYSILPFYFHFPFNPSNADATFVQSTQMQKNLKTLQTLSCWYSSECPLWVLSYEYPFARVSVIFQILCIISYWPN